MDVLVPGESKFLLEQSQWQAFHSIYIAKVYSLLQVNLPSHFAPASRIERKDLKYTSYALILMREINLVGVYVHNYCAFYVLTSKHRCICIHLCFVCDDIIAGVHACIRIAKPISKISHTTRLRICAHSVVSLTRDVYYVV